ncbi:polymer-forming cytoskeletal protein [Bacillus horti]|uniref:Cytoskeletal protein CcmA (Bactofilin family) n=1 Tax=Caldalkalibacillus horti TaxID=77523 RepID=A0ABT9VZS8_9BACI|nr:polymer-forming cytoskeletal protein [Bacillus horti]MDQ0166513.1 cytoskeletal protein CcmA (bactofilin family) [Bacillus horti]
MSWEKIDYETAKREFSIIDHENELYPNTAPYLVWGKQPSPTYEDPCERMRVFVHRGDLKVDKLEFDTNHFIDPVADMLIIDGNLVIEGDLDVEQLDVGTPGYLCVRGNLTARDLFLTSQFEVIVWGDIHIQDIVLAGEFAGGQLRCKGDLKASIFVIEEYIIYCGGRLEGTLYAAVNPHQDPNFAYEITVKGGDEQEVIKVCFDEEEDAFWLLHLPDGVSPEEFDSSEELRPYAILSSSVQDEYGGGGYSVSAVKPLVKQYGLATFTGNEKQ